MTTRCDEMSQSDPKLPRECNGNNEGRHTLLAWNTYINSTAAKCYSAVILLENIKLFNWWNNCLKISTVQEIIYSGHTKNREKGITI